MIKTAWQPMNSIKRPHTELQVGIYDEDVKYHQDEPFGSPLCDQADWQSLTEPMHTSIKRLKLTTVRYIHHKTPTPHSCRPNHLSSPHPSWQPFTSPVLSPSPFSLSHPLFSPGLQGHPTLLLPSTPLHRIPLHR
jgi:hypothetical protein